jgi:hypothetical protein
VASELAVRLAPLPGRFLGASWSCCTDVAILASLSLDCPRRLPHPLPKSKPSGRKKERLRLRHRYKVPYYRPATPQPRSPASWAHECQNESSIFAIIATSSSSQARSFCLVSSS